MRSGVWMAGLLCGCVGIAPAVAQPFGYRVIADNTTIMPGSTNTFGQGVSGGNFFAFPSTRNGRVAFWGAGRLQNTPLRTGIYEHDGASLARIADTTTSVPDSTLVFAEFSFEAAASGDGTTFLGRVPTKGYGIYATHNGTLGSIATRSTPIPDGTGTFASFGQFGVASANAEGTLFGGLGSNGQIGLYQHTAGVNSMRVDGFTPLPNGTGNFTGFGRPTALRNGSTAFSGTGTGGQGGIYRSAANGDLSTLMTLGTAVPGVAGKSFTGFQVVSDDAVGTIFRGEWGTSQTEHAYYSITGSTLTRIFGVGDPAPNGSIYNIRAVSGDSNRLAIWDDGAGQGRVLIREADGTLLPVIKPQDFFDGKFVDGVTMGEQALDGSTLALYIKFTNGSEGIYAFTVPAPGAVGVLGLAGLAAARRRRARSSPSPAGTQRGH